MRTPIDETCLPALARHAHLRFDPERGRWVVLAPGMILVPDDAAVSVLRRCDGYTRLGTIIDELAMFPGANRRVIALEALDALREMDELGILRQ